MRAENEELVAEREQTGDRPGDEELKQRHLQLSDGLFRFVKERDATALQGTPEQTSGNLLDTLKATFNDPKTWERAQEQTRHEDETWSLYRQQHEGEVGALLHVSEQRGFCSPEERKEIENEFANPLLTPTQRIGRLAARLAAIGKRM